MNKKEYLSIPNILSYIRILLIPFFIYAYLTAQTETEFYFAAGIVLLSGLTDLFDGLIARKFNMITSLGKILDPFADKLTQVSVAICLAIRIDGMRFLLAIFVIKELSMIAAGLKLIKGGAVIDGAKWFGKLATAIFYAVMVTVIAIPSLSTSTILFLNITWLNLLIIISALFMIFSFIMYIPIFFKLNKQTKK